MSPTRRYLRISPHSVLEVRIYLDDPADAGRWLLRERDPALPRVIAAVKPLILPKLREENEREKARKKGQKGGGKKGIKDVVVGDDFDVSIFLTELSTPHYILTRQKVFSPKTERMQSNSNKMTGTREEPMNVDVDAGGDTDVAVRQESQEDEGLGPGLGDIPPTIAKGKEKQDKLFVSDSEDADESDASDEDEGFQTQKGAPNPPQPTSEPTESNDEKKKMEMRTTYNGFRIYGRILCLVVKRKGMVRGKPLEGGGGQAMMEAFISTQVERQGMVDED